MARIAALIAALTSACRSRDERLMEELVEKKDRAKIVELMKNPRKEAQYMVVQRALEDIERLLWYKQFDRSVRMLRVFFGRGFFYDMSRYLGYFKGQSFEKMIDAKTQPLRDAGLHETADKQRKNLLNYFLEVDKLAAEKIDRESAEYMAEFKKGEPRRGDLDPKEALRVLQELLRDSRKAGFDKTADACQNALINIRGALAK